MAKPKKKPAPIETSYAQREELRRRGIAARVGIPPMPDTEQENRRAILPPRKPVNE